MWSHPRTAHDSPLLRPTLEKLGRFEVCVGVGLPDQITVHLDAGYDSAKTRELVTELGCQAVISPPPRGTLASRCPLGRGAHQRLAQPRLQETAICTERRARVSEAFNALANAIIIIRRLLRTAWTSYRWDTRPARRP